MPALSRKTVTVLFADVVDSTPLGESLDAEQVRALMSRYFAEEIEPLVLKGKKEPVAAWRVTDVHAEVLGRLRRFETTIVGRDDELALLRQAYVRALATRGCHLFTVLGPAGVGKTRLGREFLRDMSDEAAVLIGRCLPYGEGITFWPLREVVQTRGDIRVYVDESDAAVIETAVGARDMQVAPEETSRAVRRLVEPVCRGRARRAAFLRLPQDEPGRR